MVINDDEYISRKDCYALLGYRPTTSIGSYALLRDIPKMRHGKYVYFKKVDIDALLKNPTLYNNTHIDMSKYYSYLDACAYLNISRYTLGYILKHKKSTFKGYKDIPKLAYIAIFRRKYFLKKDIHILKNILSSMVNDTSQNKYESFYKRTGIDRTYITAEDIDQYLSYR